MIKKTTLCVCGFMFASAFAFSALADEPIGFQQYFKKGLKAFREHDDQKALRYFKIAEVYDPTNEDLKQYLDILHQRGVVLILPASSLPPEESIGYKYYLKKGIEAFWAQDYQMAQRYFRIALIFYPGSLEAKAYLEGQIPPPLPVAMAPPEVYVPRLPQATNGVISSHQQLKPATTTTTAPQSVSSASTTPTTTAQNTVSASSPAVAVPVATYTVPASGQVVAVSSSSPTPIYVAVPRNKGPAAVLDLDQISNGPMRPRMRIELGSFIIITAHNIHNFLVVDQGFIGVREIDPQHLEVDALRIGSTFLHIWDDFGRHTLYIEVVFPKPVSAATLQGSYEVQHAQPFIFTYSNDFNQYYYGKNASSLKRQSYDFNQTLGVTGETPYGFFDASGSYTDYDSFSQFDTYTVGLSQIPLEGTSNFSIRGFDALRYMSPLTMPGTRLRGAFADVDLMDNMLGLSVSEGQLQEPIGFIADGENLYENAYVDAVQLTLFPQSQTDRYSFNFATSYGPERQAYLSEHVYSVEGQHKFNDFLTLNAEEATDTTHDASLAGLTWQQADFRTALNFRNIDKNYTDISTLPAYQGETGVAWTTQGDFKNVDIDSFFETYKDRIYDSPDADGALNYDGTADMRVNLAKDLWADSNFNFMDTAAELFPERNFSYNQRLSRSVGIWNSLKAVVFAGGGFQNSHAAGSAVFDDYNRENVIAGVQLPLTNHFSVFGNYEYDWLNQPVAEGGHSNPSIINTGIEYDKTFNPKFSITTQVAYRDELGVTTTDIFLSGEESIVISAGFSYNPTPDISIFADTDASKVLYHLTNPNYDDFEFDAGMKITFGGATYWDPVGTVRGVVFRDRLGNGKFGSTDEGLTDIKVKVGDKVVTTDKNGRYTLKVRAKAVEVCPVLDSLPGGLLFSTPPCLNVAIIQGHTSHADFGLISQTGIYGIIFVDKNGTGIPNDNDQFVGKVRIILDDKTIQYSDAHGAFYFRQVSPGPHTIAIDVNSLPLNMLPSVKVKNTIDVAEGTNYTFNIPVQIKRAEGEEQE